MKALEATVAADGGRRASLFGALAFLSLGGLAVALPFVPHVDVGAMALAIAGSIGLFAILRTRQGAFDAFELYLVVGAIYFVYFGVGTMYHLAHPEEMASLSLAAYLKPALALALLGWACFTVGYALLFRRTKPSATGRLVPLHPMAILIPGILGFAGEMASVSQENLLWRGSQVSAALSAVQQAAPLFFFAWGLAWCLHWSGRLRGTRRAIVFGVLIPLAVAIVYFKVGTKLMAITMGGLPIIAFWYARRRLPKLSLLALGLVIVLVVFPLYNTFRLQSRQLGTNERLERAVDVASGWDSDAFYDRSVRSFVRRTAIVTSVAAIVRDTGRWVDYKYGETLLLTPISLFIPRLLWPDKPNINLGREVAETFHLVGSVDRYTQIAPSIVGELYWNFSIPAVVLGMFLMGGGFRWVYQRYAANRALDPVGKAIYMTLLVNLVQIEGIVAVMVGAVVKSIVLIWLVMAIVRFLGFVADPDHDQLAAPGFPAP